MKKFTKYYSYVVQFFSLKNLYWSFLILSTYRIFAENAMEIPLLYDSFDADAATQEITQISEKMSQEITQLEKLIEQKDYVAAAEFVKNWQTTFPTPASLGVESVQLFHSDLWMILGTIFFTVAYTGIEAIIRFDAKKVTKKPKNAKLIEFLWTVLPILIVLCIVIPSLSLSSILEVPPVEVPNLELPSFSVNVTGNQWFWQYEVDLSEILEYLDFSPEVLAKHADILSEPVKVEAYMLPTIDLEPGDLRGLAATNKLTIPAGVEVKLQGNSRDVIHSWSVSGFETKMDVVPGRVNQTTFHAVKPGIYTGQCSEICGPQHSFMPIEIEVVELGDYARWVEGLLNHRANHSGVRGLINYVLGRYGQGTYPFDTYPNEIGPPQDQSFRGEWTRKLYTRQAQLLQRHRLFNAFKASLGFEVNHDESHLLLNPKYRIYEFGSDGMFVGTEDHQTTRVDKYLFEDYMDLSRKAMADHFWKGLADGSNKELKPNSWHWALKHKYLHTTRKPDGAYTHQFPWSCDQVRPVETGDMSNDYSLTLPSAMSFVSCKMQWYSENFTSYDNDDGNIWYFQWYLSRLWLDGTEYQVLLDFPQNFGLKGEPVLPVLPDAYIDPSNDGCSLSKYKQELGYRFLTKRLNIWLTHETPTVLVQGFNGVIKDTGVPINEIWCAKFRFVSIPSPRNMWIRHNPQL